MIIEGLLTTEDLDGRPHLAPMGPVVDPMLEDWLLRPYQTSKTFSHLRRNPICVFHIVDDALTVVQTVLKQPTDLPLRRQNSGWILESACHWYQLRVQVWDVSNARSEASAVVESKGVLRPFWGWNRAKHAVLEATILITRLHLMPKVQVEQEFERLRSSVEKTAGPSEQRAWQLLVEYLADYKVEESC